MLQEAGLAATPHAFRSKWSGCLERCLDVLGGVNVFAQNIRSRE